MVECLILDPENLIQSPVGTKVISIFFNRHLEEKELTDIDKSDIIICNSSQGFANIRQLLMMVSGILDHTNTLSLQCFYECTQTDTIVEILFQIVNFHPHQPQLFIHPVPESVFLDGHPFINPWGGCMAL